MSPTYTHDWFTPNIPFLTEVLAPVAGKTFAKALEIGCYEGLSTNWFIENVLTGYGSNICCLDSFQGAPDTESAGVSMVGVGDRFRHNTRKWSDSIRLIIDESAATMKSHAVQWNEFYDFIYVDGSHEASAVLEDAVLAWPLLKPDGIMVFDDYQWGLDRPPENRPQLGIDSFLASYRGKFKIIGQGYQMAIIKITL